MNTPKSILVLLLAAALTPACEKDRVREIAGPPEGGAGVKFFNFAPGAPGVNFYANDRKVTAISTSTCAILTDANREQCTTTGAESTTGVTYPNAGNGVNGYYSDIAPGTYTLSGRIAAATDKDLAISSTQATIADGKLYSYYLSGVYNTTTKTADAFIVEDDLPAVDFAVAHVRLVNALSNGTGPVTLYAKNRTTGVEVPLGGEVAYKAAGAFTALPEEAYDLAVRYANGTTNVISRTNVTFANGRIYTITARGNISTASTLGLDNTANR